MHKIISECEKRFVKVITFSAATFIRTKTFAYGGT